MVGWYGRFIRDFSTLTAPISELLKKEKTRFEWAERANEAFEKLKKALVSTPVLATPDFSVPFVIQTDASDVGVGAVLTQEQDGEERVIAYMSQKLSPTQRRYHVTERECLAVLCAIEKFRPYVEGVRFTVITDHASLMWLNNLKDPTGRLARWALRLQAYDFDLRYRKGSLNVVPDALSRAIEAMEAIDRTDFESKDPCYNSIIAIANGRGQAKKSYLIQDGKIYCRIQEANNIAHVGWKLCVPSEAVEEIIRENHDNVFAAHGGFHKTMNRLRERYYWPEMKKDVRAYVKPMPNVPLH